MLVKVEESNVRVYNESEVSEDDYRSDVSVDSEGIFMHNTE